MATKTNVIGYFNPNEYPLLLSISEHNMQIHLEPKKYIVDRTGALVNDPILNAYVGKGRLSRASDPKQQVDIVHLRPVNPAPAPGVAPTAFTHSVSQATGFQVKDGRVQPIAPAPTAVQPAVVPPPVSYNPVKAYSIEDAKRLKLIRPTRPVPEDFGAEETTGAPKSGQEIPEIRYATDSVRGPKPKPLPAELAQPATPQQAAIIQGLERAATTNPDDPNVLQRTAKSVVTEVISPILPPPAPPVPILPLSGPIPGLPKPQLTESTAPAARVSAPPIPKNPTPTTMAPLPPPPVEEAESGLVVEEDLSPEAPSAAAMLPPIPRPTGLTCPRCPSHEPFKNLGLFKRHIRKFHAEEEQTLLAPFETPVPA
jgi:hypothetical protein